MCTIASSFSSEEQTHFGSDLPSLRQIKDQWERLTEQEQFEIYDEFQSDCLDGSKEPSSYWYPLLMPSIMKGYVGD